MSPTEARQVPGPPLPCHYAEGREGTGAAILRLNWRGKPPMEGVMQNWLENWTNAKFCDVANLILGAFLFFSPWIFGFDAGTVSPISPISPVS